MHLLNKNGGFKTFASNSLRELWHSSGVLLTNATPGHKVSIIYSVLLISKGPPLFLSQHRGSPSSLSYSLPMANLILLLPSALTLAHRNCRSNALKLMFSELF